MKKIYSTLFFLTTILFLQGTCYAENVSLRVIDTIAGYPTVIESSKTDPLQNFIVHIEKPDGSVLRLPSKTNTEGYIETELDGYHTKKSGLYKAYTNREGENTKGSVELFHVYADVFSPIQSKIVSDHQSLSAKNDTATIRVYVFDTYQNPISGHSIQLLSSRSEDIITAENNGISNEDGIAVFTLQSNSEGISILTAIDQNSMQDIKKREKIVFYSPEESFAIGGDMFSANLIDAQSDDNSFGHLDHFDIEFPSQVQVNNDQNFLKILAKDSNGNTVKNYNGSIRIAVTGDDNAIIPNEGSYTFTEKDQGVKEFALAMIFTSTGEKEIQVFDFEDGQINQSISGKKQISVVEQEDILGNEDIFSNSSSEIVIKSPSNGSEHASSTLTISGLALANTNLKLMLDDIKVSEISVDMEGFFSATITDILDGEHEIYAIESEGLRRASASVHFTIDATAPLIDSLELFPQEAIYPESTYTFSLYSEPKLDFAKIRVAGIEEQLTESSVTPGKYEGSFFSPTNPGDYNIDVILSDRMGNSMTYRKQAVLKVIEKVVIKPEAPTDLLATASDQKIDISWKAPASQRTIENYNIYVGSTQNELLLRTQSQSTTALITNLENGKTYFIAISAVDSEGEEGNKSSIITATPKAPEPVVIQQEETTHPVAAKPVQKPLRAISGNSKVTLTWDPFAEAEMYKILLGVKTKNYEVELKTKDSASSYVVPDLINGVPYYFSVVALNAQGQEISENYPEVKSTPNGVGFKIIPSIKELPKAFLKDFSSEKEIKGNTGPETWAFLTISLGLAIVFFLLKNRGNSSQSSSTQNTVGQRVSRKMQF